MPLLERFNAWSQKNKDYFFELIRIYLGVGLFIKAFFFVGHREDLSLLIEGTGDLWFMPAAAAHYIILAHLTGGISLALGFLTRIGALIQIPILAGAVFYLYLPQMFTFGPRQNLEFSALILFLLVLIFLRGGGPLSLDVYLTEKKSR